MRMKVRTSKVLRFWTDVEYNRIKNDHPGRPRTELIARILRKFEEAGDAMRYLDVNANQVLRATSRPHRGGSIGLTRIDLV
jgi:hypothetical protein